MEAVALGVLLLAEFGWNLSVIDRAEVPRASPDQGEDGRPTYRVPLEKPRRGPGRYYETRNVTDDGAASPGRLITQALQATRFARAIVEELAPGTDRLIVWRTARAGRLRTDLDRHPPVGPFCFGVTTDAAKDWAEAEGLGGQPVPAGAAHGDRAGPAGARPALPGHPRPSLRRCPTSASRPGPSR